MYVLFILDCMDSVAVAKLSITSGISFQCGEERNDSTLENVSVLVIRLVWKIQKTKPEIGNTVTREIIKPEVLVSYEIVSRNIP